MRDVRILLAGVLVGLSIATRGWFWIVELAIAVTLLVPAMFWRAS